FNLINQEMNVVFMECHQQHSCYVHSHSGFDFNISKSTVCTRQELLNEPQRELWKGENVATTEVADVIGRLDFIQEANVYGVPVPVPLKQSLEEFIMSPPVDNQQEPLLIAHTHPLVTRHLGQIQRPPISSSCISEHIVLAYLLSFVNPC
ncbi:hypothetical protein STEG23_009016, partial [Scotinomys teguina]